MSTVEDTIVEFVSEELLELPEQIDADANLLSEDMVDSLGMLRLIGFIEATFQVKIPPRDFTIENFRTPAVLAGYLQALINDRQD